MLQLVTTIHKSRNGYMQSSSKTEQINRMKESKEVYRTKLEFKNSFRRFMRGKPTPEYSDFKPYQEERDHLGRILDTQKSRVLKTVKAKPQDRKELAMLKGCGLTPGSHLLTKDPSVIYRIGINEKMLSSQIGLKRRFEPLSKSVNHLEKLRTNDVHSYYTDLLSEDKHRLS